MNDRDGTIFTQMRLLSQVLVASFLLGALGWSAPSRASIPATLARTMPNKIASQKNWTPEELNFSLHVDFSKGLDISVVQPIGSLRDLRSDDIARIIPHKNMATTTDSGHVAAQILDHSIGNFFKSDVIRKSNLGKTAQKMERKLATHVDFGAKEPDSIKHSVQFQMKASEATAMLKYSGLTDCRISYQIAQSQFNVELNESLARNTQLVFHHTNSPADNMDMLSMRWVW